MKKFALIPLLATLIAVPALAGDPVIGKQKAGACVACHGSESSGGLFMSLQLAGRDADKLTVKTMKYKTGKVFHPMMNMVMAFYSEKEVEDISAYYKSIGKPFVTAPYISIKGDDDVFHPGTSSYVVPVAPAYGKQASAW